MKIKLDENGKPVLSEDGHPVYIFEDEDGSEEKPVNVPSLFDKIRELNNEAKQHRLAKKELAEKYKTLEEMELENVEEFVKTAVKNAETISNFNDKDFKSAAEVEKIKQGVKESYEEKMKELEKNLHLIKSESDNLIQQKDQNIRKLLIRGAFDSSDFIREKTVLTPDIAYDAFGKFFNIEEEDGNLQVFAVSKSGDKLFSKTNPGDYAGTEEAIELIIREYSKSSDIMRASSGGNDSVSGPSRKGQKTTEQLSALSPTERLKELHRTGGKK
jgi:hypothetical protein